MDAIDIERWFGAYYIRNFCELLLRWNNNGNYKPPYPGYPKIKWKYYSIN